MSLWRWKRYKIKKSVDNNNILNIFVKNKLKKEEVINKGKIINELIDFENCSTKKKREIIVKMIQLNIFSI